MASLQDKPALVASPNPSGPNGGHESREVKLEDGAVFSISASESGPELSGAEEKKLLRRIDWRLLPLLAAMYVVKTIDAQNVSMLCMSVQIKY